MLFHLGQIIQSNCESGSFVYLAFHLHRAVKSLNNLFADTEAKSNSLLVLSLLVFQPIEVNEKVFKLVSGDTKTLISNKNVIPDVVELS